MVGILPVLHMRNKPSEVKWFVPRHAAKRWWSSESRPRLVDTKDHAFNHCFPASGQLHVEVMDTLLKMLTKECPLLHQTHSSSWFMVFKGIVINTEARSPSVILFSSFSQPPPTSLWSLAPPFAVTSHQAYMSQWVLIGLREWYPLFQ